MYDIFSLKPYQFPENFFFGSGYAGHQVEGNNCHSQWWHHEQAGATPEKSGVAVNSYELYQTDIALAHELGHQAFRTSVEWSRIEPEEGIFDADAAEHYVRLFAGLKEKGLKTFATLVHFTHPQWFEERGHFTKIENLAFFQRYVEYIVPLIAPYVDYWNVLNEFNLGNNEERTELKLNSVRYHAAGYHIIKQYSSAPVSSAHALVHYMPRRPFDRMDQALTAFFDMRDHEFFFHAMRTGEIIYPMRDVQYDPAIKGAIDYWAINCYTRDLVDARRASGFGERYRHTVMKMIDQDFHLEEMYPECITANLSRLTDKPVVITENGCSCRDDRFRIVYIALYLSALQEAIQSGVDVRGYLYWSLLDNYEWGSYTPQFGLCEVERTTDFRRIPKPSALFYRDIIRQNGFTQEILRRHLHENPSLVL